MTQTPSHLNPPSISQQLPCQTPSQPHVAIASPASSQQRPSPPNLLKQTLTQHLALPCTCLSKGQGADPSRPLRGLSTLAQCGSMAHPIWFLMLWVPDPMLYDARSDHIPWPQQIWFPTPVLLLARLGPAFSIPPHPYPNVLSLFPPGPFSRYTLPSVTLAELSWEGQLRKRAELTDLRGLWR